MNQEEYNSLLRLMGSYKTNREFLATHKPKDKGYTDCRNQIRAVDLAVANIADTNPLAAELIREWHINGDRIGVVAERHDLSIGDVAKCASWAIVEELSKSYPNAKK